MYRGRELIRVHVEAFKDQQTGIEFRHGFDRAIYVQCWNPDGSMIFPQYVQRIDTINMKVYLGKPVPGAYVTIMQQSELINFRQFPLSSQNEYTIDHQLFFDDFLIQCWNENNEIVFPSDMRKIDSKWLFLKFGDTSIFNGICNIFSTYPTYMQTIVREASSEWLYKIREKESMKHVGMQFKYNDGSTFMPKEVRSSDGQADSVFDNNVTITLNDGRVGKITALVTGLKV